MLMAKKWFDATFFIITVPYKKERPHLKFMPQKVQAEVEVSLPKGWLGYPVVAH